jgi:predicted Zn-dependent protease
MRIEDLDQDLDPDRLASRLRTLAPAGVDYCGLRVVDEQSLATTIRQDVVEPAENSRSRGAMVTVAVGDGIGFGATADLSDAGLRGAIAQAHEWARLARGRSVFDGVPPRLGSPVGRYATARPDTPALSRADRIALLAEESRTCRIDGRIVDWQASLWTVRSTQVLVDLAGGRARQDFAFTIPALHVVAHDRGITQTRSWGGRYNGFCQQGGPEVIARAGFTGAGRRTAEDALRLLTAPNCPAGTFDVILMPDQMMLQIHESIGHPLELDRILGDERNYAGTSFVTMEMFGTYQYGAPLLNVTYDPTPAAEFASFAFDDEGSPATRTFLIRDGILLQPLGGWLSQQRAAALGHAVGGVATARACSWNRPPIDRMSNLNVEPGESSLEQMIASTEDGILMQTNTSWSIDDSRNKFQFGCEWGQRIRAGKLAEVVRNPNYRGISATFWRSLAMVGNAASVDTMGTPYCGKGEPNQAIRVGHASPACKFSGVTVFGAEH